MVVLPHVLKAEVTPMAAFSRELGQDQNDQDGSPSSRPHLQVGSSLDTVATGLEKRESVEAAGALKTWAQGPRA